MMDWETILLITFVSLCVIYLWIVTILDIHKRLSNMKSHEIDNRADNDDRNKKPEQVCMRKVEISNYAIDVNYQRNSTCSSKSYPKPKPSVFVSAIRHLWRIIQSNSKECQP